ILFFVISSPTNPIILGFPWPQCPDPCISWKEESPSTAEIAVIPQEYHELHEVFSKERATQLPHHCPWDCATDLLPNAGPPKCKVYPLSLPESKAMEDYIEEALAAGFGTTKGGLGLHQARPTHESDTNIYEYLVMPHGLVNAPAVFQAIINEIFKADRYVITYIDDISIYSTSHDGHIHHVCMVLAQLLQHQLYVNAKKCDVPGLCHLSEESRNEFQQGKGGYRLA
ncbi:hypothetical protein QTP70_022942, partial [Hemibagrus guttatus]